MNGIFKLFRNHGWHSSTMNMKGTPSGIAPEFDMFQPQGAPVLYHIPDEMHPGKLKFNGKAAPGYFLGWNMVATRFSTILTRLLMFLVVKLSFSFDTWQSIQR